MVNTDRLRLRDLRPEDLDALVPVLGDPWSMRYYAHPFSQEECRAWIDRQIQRYETDGFGLWAIEWRETGAVIGDCGPTVQIVDGKGEVELGWHVHPAYQSRGIATEAAVSSRDYAFRELGLRRLVSLVRPENLASCRVAEKIGMRVEKDTHHGSEGWLHHVYAVSRREWRSTSSRLQTPRRI